MTAVLLGFVINTDLNLHGVDLNSCPAKHLICFPFPCSYKDLFYFKCDLIISVWNDVCCKFLDIV